MKRIYNCGFVFLQILIIVKANGFYSTIAPDTIQSHQNYSVSVSLHENSKPAEMEGRPYNESQANEALQTQREAAQQLKVEKYVIPKFNFDIETAESVSYNESIKITLRGQHADGKPLKGQAIITIDDGETKFEKVTDVNGTGQVEFNVLKDLKAFYNSRYGPRTIRVLAVLTEANTGEQKNKTAKIYLSSTVYKIEIEKTNYEYYENEPFEIKAFVKHLDGSSVLDAKIVARLSLGEYFPYRTEQHFVATSELDKNGMALFKVVLPIAHNFINLLVEYGSCAKNFEVSIKSKEKLSKGEKINNENNEGTDENSLATFTNNIPDSLTSLNENTGFGLLAEPLNIKVFQPFFITTYLPNSVIRDEHVTIPVFLHNYMDKALDAEVIMENTDAEYEFIESSDEDVVVVLEDKQKVKRVTVPANSDGSVSFLIRTTQLGDITLKIKAISPLAGDAIRPVLRVKPEGITNYETQMILVTPSDSKEPTKITLHAKIPEDAVSDSEYMEISVLGDFLAPTVSIIGVLVEEPPATSPKEAIFQFMRNLLVLQYLEATKRVMPAVAQKAKRAMEFGYQWQLQYRQTDGGFGETDSSDIRFTAYVARAFIQARKYITVDAAVIDDALEFLISNQLESGLFPYTWVLSLDCHSIETPESFTAFALLTLLEDKDYSSKYNLEIEKGLKYLLENIDNQNNTYALALTLLVLTKMQHSSADILKSKMQSLAFTDNGFKWWVTESPYFDRIRGIPITGCRPYDEYDKNIEVTAYTFEAYVHSEPPEKLLPIIRYLIESRYSDTRNLIKEGAIVSLQALTKFAEKCISPAKAETTIQFVAQDSEGKETATGSFFLDQDNSIIMQTLVLPKSTRQIALEAEGFPSLVYLSYRYNLVTKESKSGLNLKYTTIKTLFNHLLSINVCASYIPPDKVSKRDYDMYLVINLPSGYTENNGVNRFGYDADVFYDQSENLDTSITNHLIYPKAGEEVCWHTAAKKSHAASNEKPLSIIMREYSSKGGLGTDILN